MCRPEEEGIANIGPIFRIQLLHHRHQVHFKIMFVIVTATQTTAPQRGAPRAAPGRRGAVAARRFLFVALDFGRLPILRADLLLRFGGVFGVTLPLLSGSCTACVGCT